WASSRSDPTAARLIEEADLVLGIGLRPGTEAAVGLATAAGARAALLDAGDAAERARGAAAGLSGGFPSLRALAEGIDALTEGCRLHPTDSETVAACARSQALLRRGLALELERHRSARPWHIGLALEALARRMTPETLVVSDVSNVKLWAPLQLPT